MFINFQSVSNIHWAGEQLMMDISETFEYDSQHIENEPGCLLAIELDHGWDSPYKDNPQHSDPASFSSLFAKTYLNRYR